MTGHIQGQRDRKSYNTCNNLEITIDTVTGITVSTQLIYISFTDYRKKIFAFILGILVKNHLHLFCPLYHQSLTGLTAAIGYISLHLICLAKKSHIYETHTP